jgi:hypothetical protein
MKPEANEILLGSLLTLMGDVVNNVSVDYSAGNLRTISFLIFMAAEEFERAAEVRVVENQAMRGIFQSAINYAPAEDLKRRLSAAAAGQDDSLNISSLNTANAELKALLIDLQDLTFAAEDGESRRLDAAIWSFLSLSADKRLMSRPPV